MAYIADVTPPERRAVAFGRLGIAFGLGFVLGPALGGLRGSVDPRLPFWVAAGLSLANALYGLFILPESLPPEKRRAFEWRRANPLGSLQLQRSHPELSGMAGVLGSPGDYTWGGSDGTYFWVDPKEELAAVFMSAAPGPVRWRHQQLITALVLQAITD